MTIAPLSLPASGIARAVRRAFGWWLGELRQMVPPALVAFFDRKGAPETLLAIGPDAATLEMSEEGRPGPVVVPLRGGSDEERAAGLRAAIGDSASGRRVAITLHRSLVFSSTIELPASAGPALSQIMPHQIQRLVPLGGDEIRFDYRLEPAPARNGELRVRVFVAKLASIEKALGLARAAGLRPSVVSAAPEGEARPPIFWRREGEADANRRLRRRLEFAALIVLAVAYALYIHRLDRMRDGLAGELAEARSRVAGISSLAAKVSRIEAAASFIDGRRDAARPLEIVDALTRLVPTDSWVDHLTLRGPSIEMTGYSPHASDLVARVEASELFINPQFRSPITLAPNKRLERFNLSLDVRPRGRR